MWHLRAGLAALAFVAAAVPAAWAAPQEPTPPPRFAWQWSMGPALSDAAARTALFDLMAAHRVTTLWTQVSTDAAKPGIAPARAASRTVTPTPLTLTRQAEWRVFIAEARRRGIRVEALDGDPAWALKARHAGPLGVVEAVIAYNSSSKPDERFAGIHFDIEPYLLISWRFPRSREQLLRELLELTTRCQQRARETGMQFGVDIPFWWDVIDDATGRPIADTLFEGVRKSAARHLIDRLDNVGIMNYRNTAAGSDGLIAHGTPILAYADTVKGARIYMGVETSLSDPSDTWFVAGPPTEVVNERLQNPETGVGADGQFDGFTVRLLDDGTNTHVGLVAPDGMGETPTPVFREALVRLGRRFAASADPRFTASAEARRDRGMWVAGRDPERTNLRARVIRDEREQLDYLAFVATTIMLPKITFYGLPVSVFARELAAAETAFAAYRSFGGIAIHHLDSLGALKDAGGAPGRVAARRRDPRDVTIGF